MSDFISLLRALAFAQPSVHWLITPTTVQAQTIMITMLIFADEALCTSERAKLYQAGLLFISFYFVDSQKT